MNHNKQNGRRREQQEEPEPDQTHGQRGQGRGGSPGRSSRDLGSFRPLQGGAESGERTDTQDATPSNRGARK